MLCSITSTHPNHPHRGPCHGTRGCLPLTVLDHQGLRGTLIKLRKAIQQVRVSLAKPMAWHGKSDEVGSVKSGKPQGDLVQEQPWPWRSERTLGSSRVRERRLLFRDYLYRSVRGCSDYMCVYNVECLLVTCANAKARATFLSSDKSGAASTFFLISSFESMSTVISPLILLQLKVRL